MKNSEKWKKKKKGKKRVEKTNKRVQAHQSNPIPSTYFLMPNSIPLFSHAQKTKNSPHVEAFHLLKL